MRYFGIIFLFALGAGLGSKSAAQLGGRASGSPAAFCWSALRWMFIREELEENPVIEKRPDRHPAGDPGDRPHPEAGAAGGAAGADAERPEITKKGLLHIIGAAALFG